MTEMITPAEVLWMVIEGNCLVDPQRGPCTKDCVVFEAAVITFKDQLTIAEGKKGAPLTAEEAVREARVVRNTIQLSQGVTRAKFDEPCLRSTTIMN